MIVDISVYLECYVLNENENMWCNGEWVCVVWVNKVIYDDEFCVKEILCVGIDVI